MKAHSTFRVFLAVLVCGLLTGRASAQTTVNTAGSGSGGAGDASAANQVTGNASLASIDGKLATEADDASIAGALTSQRVNALGMAFDGSVWRRMTFGVAGTASTQVFTFQGIAGMTPVLSTLTGTNNIATVSAVTAITNALPAGTNGIGKLTANSGVDIGDVDVANFPTAATTAAVAVRCVTAAGSAFESCAGAGGGSGLTDAELRATAVPVSGTVTANLSATDNAVLDDIADGIAVTGTVTANAGTNLNTSALLTTTAHDAAFGTAGTADAQVLTVQGIASMTPLLATLSGTNNLATVTTVTTVGAVTAITNALPAGTNGIGKLTANSGVDIGDVDVTSIAAGNNNIGDVDVASSALPSGASTSANQTTEITALQLIDNLPNTLGSTTSGQSGALGLGAVTTAAPSYTNGQSNALSLATDGALRVTNTNTATDSALSTEGAAFSAGIKSWPFFMRNCTTFTAGTGVVDGDFAVPCGVVGALGVNLRNTDGTAVVLPVDVAEDAAEANGVTGPVGMSVRRDTAASSATTAGDYATVNTDSTGNMWTRIGIALPAGTAFLGSTAPMATATTTDSLALPCYHLSTASTNSINCKASAGNVYGYRFVNTTSTLAYVRMYNLASAPTCSSATGFIETVPVPQATGAGAGVTEFNAIPVGFGTGIGFCVTGGGTSTDNTNAVAGVYVSVKFK